MLTTLTKESADKVASKVDEQVGKLFGTSVSEGVSFDLDLSKSGEYDIVMYGPRLETDELMEAKGDAPVLGRWKVRMAKPCPSVFATTECTTPTCAGERAAAYALATQNPATVLKFKLVENVGEVGTIGAYLGQQEWWAEGLQAIGNGSASDYDAFCRRIRSAIAGLGLNDLDGRIVAYSVGQSGLVSTTVKTGMEGASDCKA